MTYNRKWMIQFCKNVPFIWLNSFFLIIPVFSEGKMCVSDSVFCSELCMIAGLCHSVNDVFTLGWDVTWRKSVVTDISGLHCVISQKSSDHICTCCIYMFYPTNTHTVILSYFYQLRIFYLPILLKIYPKIPKLMWPSSYGNEFLSCTPQKSMFDYV